MLMDLAERAQSDLDGDLFDAGGAQLTDHNAERQMLGFLLNKPGAIAETIDILRPAICTTHCTAGCMSCCSMPMRPICRRPWRRWFQVLAVKSRQVPISPA